MSNLTDNDTGNETEAGSQSQMTNAVEENETEVKPRSRERPVVAKSSLTARELSATELPVDESIRVTGRAAVLSLAPSPILGNLSVCFIP